MIELVKDRKTKEPCVDEITEMSNFMKSKHLFHFAYTNMLHTNPPLIIQEDELRHV